MTLAPYATTDNNSRGRQYSEPAPAHRSGFQRDRDRIIHSTAFRRLEYKTQVFVNHEGDLFRTRLTHSIEVAQIGRSIARALKLNEDLTEAIALAHDLGHTPFGHAGQDALNQCMRAYGGFEHNLQSLRLVELVEEKYAEFPGLNLMFETREGILKHCSIKNARKLGSVGERFINKTQPGLEAQLVNLADEIAYNNHDVDDGLRYGLISIDQLREIPLFARQHLEVVTKYPGLDPRRTIHETIRRMINDMVVDLIKTTSDRFTASRIGNTEDVRSHGGVLVSYSETMREQTQALKRFLRESLYYHARVREMTEKSTIVLTQLFEAYFGNSKLMPVQYQELTKACGNDTERARIVADYVAGMTDRYAHSEHRRLFGQD